MQYIGNAKIIGLGESEVWLGGTVYSGLRLEAEDGRTYLTGRVTVPTEVNMVLHSAFDSGEPVEMWFSSDGKINMLYGARTSTDEAYGQTRLRQHRLEKAIKESLASLVMCLVVIGVVMLPFALWQFVEWHRLRPLPRRVFQAGLDQARRTLTGSGIAFGLPPARS